LSLLGRICVQCSGADKEQQVDQGSGVPHLYCEMCVDLSEIYSSLDKGLMVYIGPHGGLIFFFLK
jgi:hypothetical protein